MSREPTTVAKLRGLPWSVACNATAQVHAQLTFFGALFILFLNQLGLSKTAIGLVLALVPFSSVLAPLVAPFTARYGYKRVFVIFYAARKVVTLFILAAPWVAAWGGTTAVFWYIVAVIASFAVVRTIEETAYFPWVQEFVPNRVRGKYTAMSNIATASTGFLAVWAAGQVLERSSGLDGFLLLFAVGAGFGFASVAASLFIPGGAAQPELPTRGWRQVLTGPALRDGSFRRYLLGVALVVLGTAPLATFLPLYLEERAGLTSAQVVQVQMGSLLGMLVFSYLWGWAADRYGSKPVMQAGGWLLVGMPLLWWLLPGGQTWSLAAALGIAFLQGSATLGWGIGSGRLLFVSVVPTEHKLDYMALYFAWVGLVSGLSQFAGGGALDAARRLEGTLWGVELHAYVPLFAVSALLPLAAIALFARVRGDSPLSTRQVASIFLRGNPFLAMGSLIRYYTSQDEARTVSATAALAAPGSRLTVDELLEALADPRFNVRFEAIQALARMPADPRITDALVKTLHSRAPALSSMAAWALGRGGHHAAIPALRAALESDYRSVQSYAARALGTLGDAAVGRELLARLEAATDEGLSLAYATALGRLQVAEALDPILARLAAAADESVRAELALAAARLVGDEAPYIRLARSSASQPGTSYAQALAAAHKQLARRLRGNAPRLALLTELADCFAREEVEAAAVGLAAWLAEMPPGLLAAPASHVARVAAAQLHRHAAARPEYLLLALHALTVG